MPFVSDVKIYCTAEQGKGANIVLPRIDALLQANNQSKTVLSTYCYMID